jgi:hypothetical protein
MQPLLQRSTATDSAAAASLCGDIPSCTLQQQLLLLLLLLLLWLLLLQLPLRLRLRLWLWRWLLRLLCLRW